MSLICQSNTNNYRNSIIFSKINDEVLFFPQMRPEKKEMKLVDFFTTEEEKILVNILENKTDWIEINELKKESNLSNKKFDKYYKQLKISNFVEEKNEDGLWYTKQKIYNIPNFNP